MTNSKVSKLYVIFIINKNIIRFNISMKNLNNFMTIPNSTTELSKIFPCLSLGNLKIGLINFIEKTTFRNMLTNEILFMVVRIVNYLNQFDNIRMAHFLHNSHLFFNLIELIYLIHRKNSFFQFSFIDNFHSKNFFGLTIYNLFDFRKASLTNKSSDNILIDLLFSSFFL